MVEVKPDVECVLDYAAQTGEAPTWSVREQALYWIDIQQPALHRFEPQSGQDRHWIMPAEIGSFALTAAGGSALVALRSGLYQLSLGDGTLRQLAPPPFDPEQFRFNDGACDRSGRFWTGVMYDPKPNRPSGAARAGPWYSYTESEGLRSHAEYAVIANGIGWTEDDETIFLADSNEHAIFALEFELRSGQMGQRRLFARIPNDLGVPDGCAIDEHGCYWSAIHGGGRLRRFRPDGSVERDVLLPVRDPTMCAFAGADLAMLYVTSACSKLTPAQRAREPLAGKLLRFDPKVRGRAPALFGPAHSER
jgi:sugar lactone lactonase YvrE